MKKDKRKGWRLCLTAALAVLMAACAPKEKEESAVLEKEEPVKIRVAVWDAGEAFVGDSVLEEVEKRFNIKIVPENITWDDYAQKLKLWASARNLPDLFVGDFRNSTVYMDWVQQGLIAEIPEDLSAYPNLKEYLEKPGIADDARLNQKLYCIPRQTYPSQEWTCTDRIIIYRWDLAQQAGITKEPQSWEEFCEMIEAIVQADPEGKRIEGMTTTGATLLGGIFAPYASSIAAGGGITFKWVQDSDGVYKPAYFAEDMLPAFSLARDMYERGVIAKDVLLSTTELAEERFLQGQHAALLYSGGVGAEYGNIGIYWNDLYGRDFMEDVRVLSLMPDVNGNKSYPAWGYAWSESYISAKAGEEKLNKILELYDYLLSEEGAFYTCYGPEGELYEFEDGRVKLYNEATYVSDRFPSCAVFSIMARWNPNPYDDRFVTGVPEIYDRINRGLVEEAKGVALPEYNLRCTQIMLEQQIDFSLNVNEDFCRIMAGTEPVEKMWEELKQEYEEAGLSEAVRRVNEALGEAEAE